jgi:transposase InsO family protein
LVGLSPPTLYDWKKRFDQHGPAGLADRPRGKPALGSRLPEPTQRAIQLLKRKHPDWGVDRIQDVLMRGEGFTASTGAIQRVLVEAGYQVEAAPTRRHPQPKVQSFERARPNQLWQTDLFTFTLKRENRRLYLVVFLDDHSRFVVGRGLQASSRGAMVQEALEAAIANFGPPEEILTDNGPQYHSWRGKSAFTKLLERRGIRHLVSRPRHPQTLGKTERFWGTLWRECLQEAVFQGVEDARQRIGHFIDHYNFQRPHQGIAGLVPADRYFAAESEVRKTLEERVVQNAVDLARHGEPRKSFYLTGRVGDEGISLHGEGGKVILTREGATREEVDLQATGKREHPEAVPAPDTESSGGAS